MEGYFPTDGSLMRGAHISPVVTEEFRNQLQNISIAAQKLAPEKREAFVKDFSWEQQVPAYNADIWPNKADYDKFVEERKNITIRPIGAVAVGLQNLGDGLWRILSVSQNAQTNQQSPIAISALRYDSNRNVWISNNGELTNVTEFSAPDTSIYGAQTGMEWSTEKKDDLTHMRETIRVTKTTDGKNVYLAYSFIEMSVISGANIASGAFLLQFPVKTTGANLGTPGQR